MNTLRTRPSGAVSLNTFIDYFFVLFVIGPVERMPFWYNIFAVSADAKLLSAQTTQYVPSWDAPVSVFTLFPGHSAGRFTVILVRVSPRASKVLFQICHIRKIESPNHSQAFYRWQYMYANQPLTTYHRRHTNG